MAGAARRVVLAGGSGFLGRILERWFGAQGWDVTVLSRRSDPVASARVVRWDGETIGPWIETLDGATALVNLAGRSVNCRYHATNRKLIMNSRIRSTRVLGEAIRHCGAPPAVWLNSSTATIYTHTYGPPHDESGAIGATPEAKDAFSIEVATAWEDAFNAAVVPTGTRKVVLRAAMVLGDEPGTVYAILRRLARVGLGGTMGDGRQYVSWIHCDDFCRAIEWLIERPDATGVYNIAAPGPVTNAEMMRLFRRVVGMPIGLPATRWMLEVGAFILRTETELILKSRRVVPRRLLDEGFTFKFADLGTALTDLEARQKRDVTSAVAAPVP